VQRFTFHYLLDFGADDAAFSFATETLTVTLSATAGGITAFADLETSNSLSSLTRSSCMATLWLSIDLRVFKIRANVSRFGVTMGASASQAPTFIQQAIAALTAGKGSASGDTFEAIDPSEAGSALTLLPTDSDGTAIFNFAIARVRSSG